MPPSNDSYSPAPVRPAIDPDEPRRCNQCGIWRASSDFHASKQHKDGLALRCAHCRREYHARRLREIAQGTWNPSARTWSPESVRGAKRFTPKGRHRLARLAEKSRKHDR